MSILRVVIGILWVGSTVIVGKELNAQDYPNRPIRIITGPVGGGNDFAARLIGPGISAAMAQPVIVDNRVALLAQETASKALPNGYTLIVAGSSLWLIPLLRKASYDVNDFSPISLIAREVRVLVVHPSVPVKSVNELIALAKARPGELNHAATSVGGPTHLGGELFKSMAGVNIVTVHYKGNAEATTAVIMGEVQMTITDAGSVAPHLKSNKLRALAVTSAQPSAVIAGLPTVAASGLAGYELVGVIGILAPAKTPGTIINRLNQEVVRVLNRADVKERLLSNGLDTAGSSPGQFAAAIKSDVAKMGKVIKDAAIRID